jgi:diketogulonate reductase-like aldo/keto reductase
VLDLAREWRFYWGFSLATTKLHRLEENLGATNVELTPEDLRDIESASSNIRVEGARYPEWLQPLSGR